MDTGLRKDLVHTGTFSSFSAPFWFSPNEIIYVLKYLRSDETEAVRLICGVLEEPMTREHLETLSKADLMEILRARCIRSKEDDEKNELVEKVMKQVVAKYQFCKENILVELEDADSELEFASSANGKYVAYSTGSLFLVDMVEKMKNTSDYQPLLIDIFVVAFFWSPNSRYLLYITQSNTSNMSWKIYDTQAKEGYELVKFFASTEFRQHYLPFFCQYAQSLTFFSPDSRHFVYCDDKTVKVCGVERNSFPVALCSGTFATWSPC